MFFYKFGEPHNVIRYETFKPKIFIVFRNTEFDVNSYNFFSLVGSSILKTRKYKDRFF